jgi:hypothetical protein
MRGFARADLSGFLDGMQGVKLEPQHHADDAKYSLASGE